jgi:hypothetical protein
MRYDDLRTDAARRTPETLHPAVLRAWRTCESNPKMHVDSIACLVYLSCSTTLTTDRDLTRWEEKQTETLAAMRDRLRGVTLCSAKH